MMVKTLEMFQTFPPNTSNLHRDPSWSPTNNNKLSTDLQLWDSVSSRPLRLTLHAIRMSNWQLTCYSTDWQMAILKCKFPSKVEIITKVETMVVKVGKVGKVGKVAKAAKVARVITKTMTTISSTEIIHVMNLYHLFDKNF